MKIQIELPESEQRTFSPVPPGWYSVEIFDVARDEASTGTPFLNVEFKIEKPEELKGRSVWENFYLTRDAAWKLAALQNAVGMEPESELETDELLGKRLRVRVKEVEDQEGNPRVKVVAFRRLPAEKVPF